MTVNALAEAVEAAAQEVAREPQSSRAAGSVAFMIQQLYKLLDSEEVAMISRLKSDQRIQISGGFTRVLGTLEDMHDVAVQLERLGGEALWRIPLAQAVKRLERELRRWGVPIKGPTTPRPIVVRHQLTGEFTVRDPRSPVEQYIATALQAARAHEVEEGGWVAELEGFSGVWAEGRTRQESVDALDEVLRGWLQIKLALRDPDIPVVANIDLITVTRG
jgi:predicted RNase H-like HicB family nuclease